MNLAQASNRTRLSELRSHLAICQSNRAEEFRAGEWDQVELLQLAIDDTRDEIASLERIVAAA